MLITLAATKPGSSFTTIVWRLNSLKIGSILFSEWEASSHNGRERKPGHALIGPTFWGRPDSDKHSITLLIKTGLC